MDTILMVGGVLLVGVALSGLVWCWRLGTVRQEKRPEMPADLRSAEEHKRRVAENTRIAAGRMSELESRRAVAREKQWVRRSA